MQEDISIFKHMT